MSLRVSSPCLTLIHLGIHQPKLIISFGNAREKTDFYLSDLYLLRQPAPLDYLSSCRVYKVTRP